MENTKKAALKKDVNLKEHQSRAIDKILDSEDKSLLAAHATGSGKTLTGIAAFEKLKEIGAAKRAIVVVPSSLRTNFVESGVKKFTTSSVSTYGPKNESKSKQIGDKSNSDYNVISYDLFREHGDKVIEDTGADTLIMDEVHKVRSNEGATYNKLRELRPKFKQAITLTGSVVNNEPNEIVPLLDITFKPTGHKLISKEFFDKNFVNKEAITKGFINPKVYVEKNIKNKDVLSKYLGKQIDYVGHEELEKFMPKKKVELVEVPMSKEQSDIYHYTLSAVDPITRWKISNNIPVGQREAQDAFSKLTQARQVSTDPSILSKDLKDKSILSISPKVKKIVEDAENHLKENDKNKIIIYGNLIQGQLDAIERGLKEKGIDHTKFLGVGNEGSSAKKRDKNIEEYMKGNKRVILISGAGAEGLDLKGTTMMQMAEGHYNPERIHQAESRARRLGSPVEEVLVKRYVSKPSTSAIGKLINSALNTFGATSGNSGIDSWIYSVADRKMALNNQFKEVLTKKASYGLIVPFLGTAGGVASGAGLGLVLRGVTVDQSEPYNKRTKSQKILSKAPLIGAGLGALGGGLYASRVNDSISKYYRGMESLGKAFSKHAGAFDDQVAINFIGKGIKDLGYTIGNIPASIALKQMKATTDKEVERTMKQKMLDMGKENLIGKKHFDKILNEAGISQRALDISMGAALASSGLSSLTALRSLESADPTSSGKLMSKVMDVVSLPSKKTIELIEHGVKKVKPEMSPLAAKAIGYGAAGVLAGIATPIAIELIRRKLLSAGINHGSGEQLEKGVSRYEDKLRKKMESKYKGSKKFIQEYDAKKELGLDTIL